MTEQTNLDFVTLFENDEVKVISMRGEIRVDFLIMDASSANPSR